jgi:hypothetical protein
MGEQPGQVSSSLEEVLRGDFSKELIEIQNSVAKTVFLLTRASRLSHLMVAEFETLTEAADLSGHYAVGLLLESCLADKLMFIERTRRLIRNLVATNTM